LALLSATVIFAGTAAHAQPCRVDALAQGTRLSQATPQFPLATEPLRAFYGQAPAACAWSDADATALIAALAEVESHGLDPRRYRLDAILQRSVTADPLQAGGAPVLIPASTMPARNPQSASDRDVLLTDAALTYARVMMQGQVDPAAIEDDVDLKRPPENSLPALRAALSTGTVAQWLTALPPPTADYAALRTALARYRVLAAAGGWAELPVSNTTVEPGNDADVIPALRQRLFIEGDLAIVEGGETYDPLTVVAVRRFQTRVGLNPDGRLGKTTIQMMNIPVGRRLDQIAANLDRRRAFGRVLPTTRIEVNVPGATGVLYENGIPTLTMRVVVGDRNHPTPMLASAISSIVINPPWNVPYSITSKEILPKLATQPDYLERNRLRWVGEGAQRLVQDPGPGNSLGRIKFDFRNKFDVYLHDTSSRSFFTRDNRAQSHGCVRVEFPVDLAARLLQEDPSWPRQNIEKAIAAGTTLRVAVKRPIPVVLSYWTAFVAQDGIVEFRRDVYGRDARHAAALYGRSQATSRISTPARTKDAPG
jgi:murein L,D-transpeptidase YcbB/YkuD